MVANIEEVLQRGEALSGEQLSPSPLTPHPSHILLYLGQTEDPHFCPMNNERQRGTGLLADGKRLK